DLQATRKSDQNSYPEVNSKVFRRRYRFLIAHPGTRSTVTLQCSCSKFLSSFQDLSKKSRRTRACIRRTSIVAFSLRPGAVPTQGMGQMRLTWLLHDVRSSFRTTHLGSNPSSRAFLKPRMPERYEH